MCDSVSFEWGPITLALIPLAASVVLVFAQWMGWIDGD